MWVPIALGRDIPRGVTRAVHLDGQELVIWRGEAGSAQVWEDRCPHRGMRLSLGFVRENSLNCLYHGWEYGAGGSCAKIPAHPDLTVPPTIRANAFGSSETGGMILVDLVRTAGPPPVFLAGRPIASLAIASDIGTVLALAGGLPEAGVQAFETELDDVRLTIGWHVPGPGKLMLHVVAVDPGNVESRALVALHRLRAQAEAGVAA